MRKFDSMVTKSELRDVALRYVDRTSIRELDELSAVALTGSVVTGPVDAHSDVDVMLVFEAGRERAGEFPPPDRLTPDGAEVVKYVPDSKCKLHWRGHTLDVIFREYDALAAKEWTIEEKWRYSGTDVVYETDGAVSTLFDDVLSLEAAERKTAVRWHVKVYRCYALRDAWTWLERGDPQAAQHLTTQSVESLVKLLFLREERLVPIDKWLVPKLRELDRVDDEAVAAIREAMLVRGYDEADVRRRVTAADPVWRSALADVAEEGLVERRDGDYLDL